MIRTKGEFEWSAAPLSRATNSRCSAASRLRSGTDTLALLLLLLTGEAGTGNVIEAVRHARKVSSQIALASTLSEIELYNMAKEISAPVDLLRETAKLGRLPVVMFSAGGIATPADAALMMKLGMDGVFVYVPPSPLLSPPVPPAKLPLAPDSQWIRHLQILQPRRPRTRHRTRHDALQRPFQTGGGVGGTGRGDEGRGEVGEGSGEGDDG